MGWGNLLRGNRNRERLRRHLRLFVFALAQLENMKYVCRASGTLAYYRIYAS